MALTHEYSRQGFALTLWTVEGSPYAGGSDSEHAGDALPALPLGPHTLGCRDPLGGHHARPAADAALAAGVVQAEVRVVSDDVDAELCEHRDDARGLGPSVSWCRSSVR